MSEDDPSGWRQGRFAARRDKGVEGRVGTPKAEEQLGGPMVIMSDTTKKISTWRWVAMEMRRTIA